MKNRTYRGEWCGTSHPKEKRQELLKTHEEFKKMLDNGFQIKEVKVKHKRPRIQKSVEKENFKIVMVFGKPMKLTIQEYNDHWAFTIGK